MTSSGRPETAPRVAGRAVLVIGVGNDYRGDDAAGLLAARSLRGRLPEGVEVIEHGGEATGLVETWKGVRHVYVLDAIRSGAPPGQVGRWEGLRSLPQLRAASSHALGLNDAIRLGQALRAMPGTLVVYGIEGVRFDAGDRVSEAVVRGAHAAADRLRAEVAELVERSPEGKIETKGEDDART